jgi:uncharacterized membrane protein/uncharacterized membrane protein YeaQ/YmgE (transglycosylase-associated protein family)
MIALTWMLTGLFAGWLARRMMRGRSYGLFGDLLLGSIGALVGGWVMRLLGVTDAERGLLQVLVALIGAMLVIGAARLLARLSDRTSHLIDDTQAPLPTLDLENLVRRLGDRERGLLTRLIRRGAVARDPNREFEENLTFGDHVADRVASFGGSWTFIGLSFLLLFAWMILNTEATRPFDPYPFILLNLLLSMMAALQAPVIMMSQNRQAAKDRLSAQLDYEVNLRSELQIQRLHATLEEARLVELARMLVEQGRAIEEIRRCLEPPEHTEG